jgi:hypothetical protein
LSVLVKLKVPGDGCVFDVLNKPRQKLVKCGKPGTHKIGRLYLCQEHAAYVLGLGGAKEIEEGGKW